MSTKITKRVGSANSEQKVSLKPVDPIKDKKKLPHLIKHLKLCIGGTDQLATRPR